MKKQNPRKSKIFLEFGKIYQENDCLMKICRAPMLKALPAVTRLTVYRGLLVLRNLTKK